jgi:hypothetical protein
MTSRHDTALAWIARESVGVEVGDRHGWVPVSNENDQREPNII